MKFKSDIEVQAGLKDSSGAIGASGQVLSSTGSNVSWINQTTIANDVQNTVKAGVAINKGQAVYVTGADGTNIIVGLASNATEATSSKTLGLLNATVAINGFADVVQIGRLSGLNTAAAVVGDPVWLGTGGNLIYGLIGKPYAPANLVFIGIVTRVNVSNGEIFVNVQNGFELNEIHDVDLKTVVPVNGDILGYNGTLWVNKTIAGWLGYTPANASGTVNYVSKFTGTTTLGNSLIYDNGTNVGINNNTPNYALDVIGSASISSNIYTNNVYAVSFGTVGYANSDTLINTYVGKNIVFSVNSSEKARITSTGSFGIGTASPSQLLHVVGNARITGGIYDSANAIGTSGQVLSSTGTGTSWVTPTTGTITGSGTTNYVTKFTGTSSIGNSQLFDNGTNVGIGTASPISKLQTSGTITVGGGAAANTTGNMQLLTGGSSPINNRITYGTDGTGWKFAIGKNQGGTVTDQFVIQDNGNVGIGNTSPGYNLDVTGSIRATQYVYANDSFVGNTLISTSNNDLLINKTTAYSILLYTNGTEKMRINSAGNVGIGTTSPLLTASGRGNLTINGSSTSVLTLGTGGVYRGYLYTDGTNTDLSSATALLFGTNGGTERMRITAAGNVGIGTTAPGYKLDVNGSFFASSIATNGLLRTSDRLYVLGDNPLSNWISSSLTVGYSATNSYGWINSANNIILGTDGSERMRITSAGNVGIGTSSPMYTLHVNGSVAGTSAYVNLSDERYKKDILPIENALDKVLSLNGVTFNWDKQFNPGTKLDDANHIGLIAQEVEKVIPQAVSTGKDGNQTKSVAYTDLVPVLIEAIKEQQKQIEELKKLINK